MLGQLVEILPTILLIILLGRALWRAFGLNQRGEVHQRTQHGTPSQGERMVRDPVCGTFVLPSRALSSGAGSHLRYFCSEKCRLAYQKRPPEAKETMSA